METIGRFRTLGTEGMKNKSILNVKILKFEVFSKVLLSILFFLFFGATGCKTGSESGIFASLEISKEDREILRDDLKKNVKVISKNSWNEAFEWILKDTLPLPEKLLATSVMQQKTAEKFFVRAYDPKLKEASLGAYELLLENIGQNMLRSNLLAEYYLNVKSKKKGSFNEKILERRRAFILILGKTVFLESWKTLREYSKEVNWADPGGLRMPE